MGTLLLRLSGPMQSWGLSRFDTVRDTHWEPTKSGVVGLLCAALGRRQDVPVDDLAALAMGVRVDQPGRRAVDYHTVDRVRTAHAQGAIRKGAVITRRYYLADAKFLVALESDDDMMLRGLSQALRNPRWLLSLGRKAFPAAESVWLADGLRTEPMLEALAVYPWLGAGGHRRYPERLSIVVDDPESDDVRGDVPLSPFAATYRRFGPRRVTTLSIPAPPKREEETE